MFEKSKQPDMRDYLDMVASIECNLNLGTNHFNRAKLPSRGHRKCIKYSRAIKSILNLMFSTPTAHNSHPLLIVAVFKQFRALYGVSLNLKIHLATIIRNSAERLVTYVRVIIITQ